MKGIKKGLAILLVLCTLLSMVVMTGAGVPDASQDAQPLAASNDSFMKMVLLDGGRGYISVENVEAIIDQMARYDYDYLVLGFGNDGLRFLLNDMSVEANGTTYDGETIKSAITAKNNELAPNAKGEWTQNDMGTILSYAAGKGISIVPFLNTPGHATSIVAAMQACEIDVALENRNDSTDVGSVTFDVTNSEAVAFVEAFVQKYIEYFSANGCTYFNLGMDEFAGNHGGWTSMNPDEKTALNTYLTALVNKLTEAKMTPLAFCDVIGNMIGNMSVPDSLIGINWNGTSLSGHSNVNANFWWYYVLGATGPGWAGYDRALSNVKSKPVTQTVNDTAGGAGSLLAIWNDNNVAFTPDEVAKVNTLIRTQAINNSNFTTPEEKEISVPVGDTFTETIDDVNYAGSYPTEDSSIATVEVTGKDATEATTTYNKESVTCNNLINSNKSSWTAVSGYYYTPDGGDNYYPVYAKRDREWNWTHYIYTYTWGYSETDSSNNVQQIGTQTESQTSASPNIAVYTKSTTPATSASTTITFTGKSVGTTYVTIGDVRYVINVTPENLDGKTLTYHPWISDYAVYPEGYNQGMEGEGVAREVELSAKSPNVNSEAGVPLAELVENTGDWMYEGDTVQTYFWKGVVLASGNHQVGAKVDKSMTGADFTYIRYWGGNWSYSSDRQTWTAVKDTDEVCAYYLMKTQVTNEVDTYVKDWAFTAADAKDHTGKSQKALSFAVVYPNGQMSPAEKDIYQESTLIYWFDTAFGFIRIGTNEVYEVEKITYTMGDRQNQSGAWQPNETINWEKTQLPDGTTRYNETVCWDETYNTEPVVNGADLPEINNNTWGANDAVLILIYLKPVVTEDSLTVRYWDDSANSEIYSYPVNIKNTAGEKAGTFLNRLMQKNDVKVGDFTLDDDAYVVNAAEKHETFEKDLTKVPNLFGKYTSGLYNYVKADISADGKTLTLHYNLNAEQLNKKYVLDFGLPVTVPLSDLVANTNVTKVEASVSNTAGTATVGDDNSITFTPVKVMAGVVTMTVTVTYKDGSTNVFTVGFYPATTVYYEEGFAVPYPEGTANVEPEGTSTGLKQTTSAVGSKDRYGYDDAYSTVDDSSGTAMKLAAGKGAATFTFTGTGVDIYTRSTTGTGSMMVRVVDAENNLVKVISVNTIMQNGKENVTDGQAVTAYNVPVVSMSGLQHGTYTLQMAAVKSGSAGASDVYIDGFRVHGTLDVNSDVYQQDGEANPTFVELRNSVLNAVIGNATPDSIYAGQIADKTMSQVYAKAEAGVSALIVTKSGAANLEGVAVKDLLDNGPKNEIYLRKGESLVFTVNADSAQIGLKALNAATDYTINGQTASLKTSTDMFYPLDLKSGKTITITNTGEGILSITELKLFGADASTPKLSAPALARALVSLGYEAEPVAATATLNITVQCGDKAIPVALTAEGMSNETHTFTAAEIKAAVEQALPEGYTVEDVTFTDVTVACGEASDVTFSAAEIPAAPVSVFQKIVQVAVKIVKKLFGWL